jgi:hypothetical protein
VKTVGVAIIWLLTSAHAAAAKPRFEDFAVSEPPLSVLAAPDLGIIDRGSGRVFFPDAFIAMSFAGLDERPGFQYRRDSRLIVACGDPGEKDKPACRYYEWTGTSAKLIETLPARRSDGN